ncbi:tautomerase family protein [Helicobacter pylori]|uniref:tautomerase family protein n=1 Tax=Helicobacter pylori TaxID=210 RepID=UPI001CC24BE1|nr:tautomerase family protein [Helicobacter pylori]
MNEKELVISVTELVSKALHKNKASIRIRLCGIIAETDANNYGLGLKESIIE